MIGQDDVPADVRRLAVAAFLQGVSAEDLSDMSPPVGWALAQEAGVTTPEAFIASMRWLGEFHLRRAEVLRGTTGAGKVLHMNPERRGR